MTLGRLAFPALRWRPATGFSHEDRAIDEALRLGVGGFIVFGVPGARGDEIARLTTEIRRRAGRPLLIGADLERGAGQQARRLTEIPPPAALASLGDDEVIRWAAATTAREARSIGIDWVFAPDADLDLEPRNPIVQTRSFGADPALVARHVSTWVKACQAEGALACAKHFPGHGRTTVDSHNVMPAVPTPIEELAESDLRPFAAAVNAGVASVMTAHVAFPAWDRSGAPATRSATILGYLRRTLGFEGLVVTDAFIMEGARAGASEGEAAVASLAAGCDILLYPGDLHGTLAELERAAGDGRLPATRVEAALARYEQAVRRAGHPDPAFAAPSLVAGEVARRLLARGLVRGELPDLAGGIELTVVDDDLGGWYAPGPSDYVLRWLAGHGVHERFGGKRIVLAFAEPRAAKGRAGFGSESRERLAALAGSTALLVLFAHPRLVEELPAGPPVLVAWHRQRLMQETVAEWLAGRVGGDA
ncbi:MAG TPA: glycoside hydrolase family 3 N-terminal domain-containing protein [Gemmatimonadales bacterium]|nr:glycoside hydrolase family 3 N-terminal domain-containing protein [Gemmatimonadales bacterium]